MCNLLFLAFTVACALATNLNMLIGFRFMAGIWGSAPITNGMEIMELDMYITLLIAVLGGGTIADLVSQESRGKAMSIFVMGPIIGPIGRA